jgi:hypothetical protein
MIDYGKFTNLYIFSANSVAIEFENASIVYSKGNDWYNKLYIEPVTGMQRNSVCKIDNRAEFLDNLLEILREANIRKQLEAAPLDKIVTIRSGDKSARCVISDRKAVKHFTKRLLKELREYKP